PRPPSSRPPGSYIMTDRTRRPNGSVRLGGNFFPALALVLAFPAPAPAAAPAQAAAVGQPVTLVVAPETIRLSGPRAVQQLVVTGRYRDGSERDLTPSCAVTAESAGVVSIGRGGFLEARGDGCATLVVRAGSATARV